MSCSRRRALFEAARASDEAVVLNGFHAVKHALRFSASMRVLVCADRDQSEQMLAQFAPDVGEQFRDAVEYVDRSVLAAIVDPIPSTGVIGIAQRPAVSLDAILANKSAPVVLLENPRQLANVGACIRVAAAAGSAGVLTTGEVDPWHPSAIRGSAGLHFAVPVARVSMPVGAGGSMSIAAHFLRPMRERGSTSTSPTASRPLVAVDPTGERFNPQRLSADAVLAFGNERQGLSEELLAQADACVALPMQTGVSSMNLATSVAAVLYSWRLCGGQT